MATRKGGPPKRGAALAAAASSLAAAAASAGDDGDEDEVPRTAGGKRLTDAAAETISEGLEQDTKEPRSTIKRLSETDNKYATLDIVDAALVTEEWIARTYGGGKYRVMTHGPTRDGRWGYIRNQTYEIDASIPFRGALMGRVKPTLHNPDGSIVGGAHVDPDMNALMKSQIVELVQSSADVRARDRESSSTMTAMMMQMMKESADRNQQFMQLMITMMGNRSTGPSLTELLGAITPLVAPLLGSRKDPIEVATQLMALTGRGGGGSQLSEVIAAVKELRETAGLFGPQGDGEPEDTSLLGSITRMAPQLLALLTQAQQREAVAPVAPGAPSATATFQPNPAAPAPALAGQPTPGVAQPEETSMGVVTAMLKPYAGMLVERAMADDDPFDLGHSVALMIPPYLRETVAQFIAQETATADVIAAIPELAPYPAWVNELLDGVRERFNPSEVEDDDDEPAPQAAVPPGGNTE